MDNRRRLVPKPHIIKAIRARNWSLEGAIEELIDNSIGHGRANNVAVAATRKVRTASAKSGAQCHDGTD